MPPAHDATFVVFVNGCFDLLHAGHVTLLQFARQLGDTLIVGLNSDKSVGRLKGPLRPIIPQEQRKYILLALGCVDDVEVFDANRPLELIRKIHPDVYVRGPEYAESESPESQLVAELGGRVVSPQRVAIQTSTGEIIKTINGRYQPWRLQS